MGNILARSLVDDLESSITDQEILNALHDINENKIPRSDGFNLGVFYP